MAGGPHRQDLVGGSARPEGQRERLVAAISKAAAEHGYAGLTIETVLTAGFLVVILGSTDSRAPAGFAPIAIGLALTLIHLISIPVTNTSVNPARSTGPALFVGGWALQQLWLFWVAPLVGGVLGGVLYRWLSPDEPAGIVSGN